MYKLIKNSLNLLEHNKLLWYICVLLFLLLWYFIAFGRGYVITGDLGSSFFFKNDYLLNYNTRLWLENNFLGYDATIYNVIRYPYVLLSDLITFLFGSNFYWLFFVFIGFFRYFAFSVFIRDFIQTKSIHINEWFLRLVILGYTLSFFFFDRLFHVIILFAASAIPLLLYSYRRFWSKQKVQTKHILAFIFSSWILLSSIHMSIITAYIIAVYSLIKIYQLVHTKQPLLIPIVRVLVSAFGLIVLYAYIFVPLIYEFFTNKTNLVTTTVTSIDNAIYNYSNFARLPISASSGGFFYSPIFENLFLLLFASISGVFFLFLLGIYAINSNNSQYKGYFIATIASLGLVSFSASSIFIPVFKFLVPAFSGYKDITYFSIVYVILLFTFLVIGSISIPKYQRIWWERISIAAIVITLVTQVSSHLISWNFIPAKIPQGLENISKIVPTGSRMLVLPADWLSAFDWTGSKVSSGFFDRYFSQYEVFGSTIVEGTPVYTKQFFKSLQDCISQRCTNYIPLLEILRPEYILLSKNLRSYPDGKFISKYNEFARSLIKNDLVRTIYQDRDFLLYKTQNITTNRFEVFGAEVCGDMTDESDRFTFLKQFELCNLSDRVEVRYYYSYSSQLRLTSSSEVKISHDRRDYYNVWILTTENKVPKIEFKLTYSTDYFAMIGRNISTFGALIIIVGIAFLTFREIRDRRN